MKSLFLPILLVVLSIASGCRTLEPANQLHVASSADISKIQLLNGQTVIFNSDMGWFDRNAGTIEGVTVDSQHIVIPIKEANRVETTRAYSVLFLIFTAIAPLAAGLYGLWRVITL